MSVPGEGEKLQLKVSYKDIYYIAAIAVLLGIAGYQKAKISKLSNVVKGLPPEHIAKATEPPPPAEPAEVAMLQSELNRRNDHIDKLNELRRQEDDECRQKIQGFKKIAEIYKNGLQDSRGRSPASVAPGNGGSGGAVHAMEPAKRDGASGSGGGSQNNGGKEHGIEPGSLLDKQIKDHELSKRGKTPKESDYARKVAERLAQIKNDMAMEDAQKAARQIQAQSQAAGGIGSSVPKAHQDPRAKRMAQHSQWSKVHQEKHGVRKDANCPHCHQEKMGANPFYKKHQHEQQGKYQKHGKQVVLSRPMPVTVEPVRVQKIETGNMAGHGLVLSEGFRSKNGASSASAAPNSKPVAKKDEGITPKQLSKWGVSVNTPSKLKDIKNTGVSVNPTKALKNLTNVLKDMSNNVEQKKAPGADLN